MKKLFLLVCLLMVSVVFAQRPAKHKNGVIVGGGTTDPTGQQAGQLWWDTDDLKFRVWNGISWEDLIPSSTGATQLSELSDVDNGLLATARFMLIADGTDWHARYAIPEDIDASGFSGTTFSSISNLLNFMTQTDEMLLAARTTGVLWGGKITSATGETSFDLSAGKAQLLDNTTQSTPTYTLITWTDKTDVVPGTVGLNWYYIDADDDTLDVQTTEPTIEQRKTKVYLCRVNWDGTNVVGFAPEIQLTQQSAGNFRELADAFGEIKLDGLVLSAASTDMTIAATAGTVYDFSANYYSSHLSPNQLSAPAFDTSGADTFNYYTSAGLLSTGNTDIDVGNYQVGGVVTAVPGSQNSRCSIFFVWYFAPTDAWVVSYSNDWYNNMDRAVEALGAIDPIATVTPGFDNVLLVGAVVVEQNETDLSDANGAVFVQANKFGQFGGAVAAAGNTISGSGSENELAIFSDEANTLTTYSSLTFDGTTFQLGDINIDLTMDNTAGTYDLEAQTSIEMESNAGLKIHSLSEGNTFHLDPQNNFLRYTDDLQLQIDSDNNGTNNFIVADGTETNIFTLDEDGIAELPAQSITEYDNGSSTTIPTKAAANRQTFVISISDLETAIETGTDKGYFHAPYSFTIDSIEVGLLDAGTVSGITIDVNVEGVSILSTLLTTDATEDHSSTATTAAVISDATVAKYEKVTIDIDAVGTDQLGGLVYINVTRD